MYEYIDEYFNELIEFNLREEIKWKKYIVEPFSADRYHPVIKDEIFSNDYTNPLEYLIDKFSFQKRSMNFETYSKLMYNPKRKLWMFAQIESIPFHFGWNEKTDEVLMIFEEDNSIYRHVSQSLKSFFKASTFLLKVKSIAEATYRDENNIPQEDDYPNFLELIKLLNLENKYWKYWGEELCLKDEYLEKM